jgi:hypothetical protein
MDHGKHRLRSLWLTENLSSKPSPFVATALGVVDETQAHTFDILLLASAVQILDGPSSKLCRWSALRWLGRRLFC